MTLQQAIVFGKSTQKRNLLVLKALLLLVFITVGVDYFFSEIQNTSFYLSESLLFSTYWLLFVPLLNMQWKMTPQSPLQGLLYAGLVAAVHLICYPALVWLISKCFYGHTFPYGQTFDYGLTAYLVNTLLIYGLSLLIIMLLRGTPPLSTGAMEVPPFIHSLLVPDRNNLKIRVQTSDILYFSANSPYVDIYHPAKKYLLTGTLRSLEKKLSPDHFVRIHKSCIVNVEKVVSCRSRLNGDYDLELCDGTLLRLSRNYTADFRAKFHRHTPD